MFRQDSPDTVRTPRDDWEDTVKTCVHRPKELQKKKKMFKKPAMKCFNITSSIYLVVKKK